MDLSKIKVEVYDFLAVIIPGLFVLYQVWIALRGWGRFAQGVLSTTASGFTISLLVAFALGTLLQESADVLIKILKGKRYFKASRDSLWESKTGDHVSARITKELGHAVQNVDVAFDYCLTKIQGSFYKRDLFVANSDFARGMILVSWVAIAPLVRITNDLHTRWQIHIGLLVSGVVLLFLISCLCWTRMKRFRDLSERPVFHAYLARAGESKTAAAAH
jgi:hypothetical protein